MSTGPEMIVVAAGAFTMGHDDAMHGEEAPAHQVTLSAYRLDSTLVTVEAFGRFVAETGYRTTAEQLGFGMVSVEGDDDWKWTETPGASWRTPWGPNNAVRQAPDHPVVQVSWNDADAYCRHYGKRLPTEAEWEYAMRAGREGTRFPWGDDPTKGGEQALNFWQGEHHGHNDREDGFVYTSPVTAFPPNAWGFYDPVGNVWQWVADWYGADTYTTDRAGVLNPKGPADGWAKVARGGSWWCSANTCSGYGLFARGKSRPDSPYPNNGFRCAADP